MGAEGQTVSKSHYKGCRCPGCHTAGLLCLGLSLFTSKTSSHSYRLSMHLRREVCMHGLLESALSLLRLRDAQGFEVDIDGVGVDKSALVGFFLCEAGQVASICVLACLLTRVFRPRKPKELQSCCSLLKYQIFPTQSAASHSGSVLSPQPYTPETFGGCLKPLKPSVLNLVFEASSPQPPNPKLQNPKHIRAQNLNPRPHSKTLQDSSP